MNQTVQPWWLWLRRAGVAAFFLLVGWLLWRQARAVEWDKVLAVLGNYPASALLGAITLALLSLILYSCFDLLGRRYTGHSLRASTVIRVTFISYMFNLNLGALVGGVAFRYRLYSRLGLRLGVITRVLSISMLTNWTGYLLLAGLVFGFHPPTLPAGWAIGSAGLKYLGLALVTIPLVYLALCALSRKRSFKVRGHHLPLPSWRLAIVQLSMGATNWLLMCGVMYMLLQQRIGFSTVVGVLLVAAIAGAVTHVPAGIGVLETVFVVLLAQQLPKNEILAALLAYRAIYYLAPLTLAAVLYLVAETRENRHPPR
jgi:hypothetical protein